jgi:3-oxoacyl-[acyl-carrier protein] reductase
MLSRSTRGRPAATQSAWAAAAAPLASKLPAGALPILIPLPVGMHAAALLERTLASLRRMDVTDTDDVATVAGEVGDVDVLVNNAGLTRDALLARLRDEDLEAVLDANLKGAMRCARAALRPMLKQREGRIIQVTSVVGEQGNAGQTAYSASKAGLVGMTRSLALEVARRGITVNAVSPGFVETEMTAALSEAQREAVLAKIPLGRVGTPADIAPAVVYLASAAGAWVTGQVLRVNGGMYL